MAKIYAVSDVHGYFAEMKKALDEVGFDPQNPQHLLVSCGDAMDRGHQPRDVIEFLNHKNNLGNLNLIDQEQMELSVQQEVMEAAAEQEAEVDGVVIPLQEQEVQEVLVVLEEGVEAAEYSDHLGLLLQQEKMLVMAQQEVMAEVEGAAAVVR